MRDQFFLHRVSQAKKLSRQIREEEMKILITGITGRIGANLATQLVQDGHSVRGFVWPRDSRVANLTELGVELVSGSLTDSEQVNEVVFCCIIEVD